MSTDATTLSKSVERLVESSIERKLVSRIWRRDAKLWKDDPKAMASIENRLGWLDAPEAFLKHVADIEECAKQAVSDGITSVVLLGMGGSSLCVEVLRDVLGVKEGYPAMHVIDSTHPDHILRVESQIDLDRTLFVIASKSGSTLESDSLFQYFWAKLERLQSKRGQSVIAITDPDTVLDTLGAQENFRRVFLNPPDIGGRFSVLSYFGLVPAALMGIDITELLSRAASEAGLSRSEDARNPSLIFASWIAEGWKRGKDKLTIVSDPKLQSFGAWAEQLVAESTGKEGKGILPIDGENADAAEQNSGDRLFVHLTLGDATMPENLREDPDHLELHLTDIYDLGAEFFRWEFATAALGALMEINPFDEPNVAEAKAQTNKVLAGYDGSTADDRSGAALKFPDVSREVEGVTISGDIGEQDSLSALLDRFLSSNVRKGSYIAVMAYVDRSHEAAVALDSLRTKLEVRYGVPVTIGYGPRYLHSTGQQHKGGPNTGVFVQIVDKPKATMPVPTKNYDFATLVRGQAIGDYEALRAKHRPVLSFDLGSASIGAIAKLA